MKNVCLFYDHLNNLRPFGIIYGCLVKCVVIWYIFPHFGIFGPRKIWQPWSGEGQWLGTH
jgi:hypothetical protein